MIRNIRDKEVFLCADNQNALQAVAGGPTTAREFVRAFLKNVKVLQRKGCKIKRKCSPSDIGIIGNE